MMANANWHGPRARLLARFDDACHWDDGRVLGQIN